MPGSKEDIATVLDQIVDLFDRIHPIGNKAQRKVTFQPVANKIQDLQFLISEIMPHMLENVGRIKWHYGAAFGVDVTNGHSYEQHMEWASRAIYRIRAELKKNGENEA